VCSTSGSPHSHPHRHRGRHLEDGTLDQDPALLAQLDVVVASVHSKLRMPSANMTPRMIASHPRSEHGHPRPLHGPYRRGTRTPESTFDADVVFTACREHDVAVEVKFASGTTRPTTTASCVRRSTPAAAWLLTPTRTLRVSSSGRSMAVSEPPSVAPTR